MKKCTITIEIHSNDDAQLIESIMGIRTLIRDTTKPYNLTESFRLNGEPVIKQVWLHDVIPSSETVDFKMLVYQP